MAKDVDGGGTCEQAGDARHEWRYAQMYQVNPPPPRIQGAPPTEPARVFARYYCIWCLNTRDKEVPIPTVAPVVVQNMIALQAPAGPRMPLS